MNANSSSVNVALLCRYARSVSNADMGSDEPEGDEYSSAGVCQNTTDAVLGEEFGG